MDEFLLSGDADDSLDEEVSEEEVSKNGFKNGKKEELKPVASDP